MRLPQLLAICFVTTLPYWAHAQADLNHKADSDTVWAADVDWQKYKGKVVYVDFWASWCGPCRQSFPWMNAMQKKYGEQGLVVLAINLDQDPAKAAKFLSQNPAQFIVKYDPKGLLAEQMAVKSMPSSFIRDRQGRVVAQHSGFHSAAIGQYEDSIKTVLEKQP